MDKEALGAKANFSFVKILQRRWYEVVVWQLLHSERSHVGMALEGTFMIPRRTRSSVEWLQLVAIATLVFTVKALGCRAYVPL